MVPLTWCIHYWSDLDETSYGCSLIYSPGVNVEFSWIFFLEIRFFPTFPIVMDLEKFRSNHGSPNLVHSLLVRSCSNFVWMFINLFPRGYFRVFLKFFFGNPVFSNFSDRYGLRKISVESWFPQPGTFIIGPILLKLRMDVHQPIP